ncbi:MAG: hypothetical protein J5523_00595 [Muribaculaceae bacterium]|nr:hypothetical protein [Muribaculaceae bacterium]
MKKYVVYYEYASESESGTNRYRFDNKEDALNKFAELSETIEELFGMENDVERIDEDDFFGIRDRRTGDYAKVLLQIE